MPNASRISLQNKREVEKRRGAMCGGIFIKTNIPTHEPRRTLRRQICHRTCSPSHRASFCDSRGSITFYSAEWGIPTDDQSKLIISAQFPDPRMYTCSCLVPNTLPRPVNYDLLSAETGASSLINSLRGSCYIRDTVNESLTRICVPRAPPIFIAVWTRTFFPSSPSSSSRSKFFR